MRLAQISDRTLDALDLTRAEAREEARAGRLWASSRVDVAIAPDEAAARWALETEQVELVECSTLPEEVLDELGVLARVRRELRRRSRQIRAAGSWDPAIGRLEVILPPIGESAWHEGQAGMAVGADIGWRQISSAADQVHTSWPATKPVPDWLRSLVEKG